MKTLHKTSLVWRDGRRWFSTAVIILVLMLLGLILGQVSAVDDPGQLVPLRTANVTLQEGVYELAGSRYAVIKLARNLRRAEMDALSSEGVRLLSYLGDGAFIAGIDPGALTANVSAAYGVKAAAPWGIENKATPALRQGIVPEAARMEAGYLRLNVLFFADVSRSEIEAILGRHVEAFEVESPPLRWEVEIEPASLDGLLSEQGIHVVEPAITPDLLLDQARALIHADEVQQAVITGPYSIHYEGLTGKGVTLQVSEGVWDGHPDFQDENGKSRFVSPSPGSGSDHGTGTAGIMGGNGKLSASLQDTPYFAEIGRWRGVAPEVMLYEGHYYGGQGHLVDASNHSFTMSSAYDTGYGSQAASVDRQVRGDDGPDLSWPQIWAAGNNGYGIQHNNEVGYYSIYSPAKNNVVVGAVNANDGSLSTKVSSLGPTFDGRIKPDVMAPGSKNHLPREFNIYEDKIQMSIDYIRVINERTGSIDARWEFNTDGDPEGWFQSTEDTCQISGLTASGGYLNFVIGYVPTEKCGDYGYGHNRAVDFESDPDQVIVMRYKMRSPAGSLTAGGRISWGWEDNTDPAKPVYGDGKIKFPSVANDQWVNVTIPVGRWGQTRSAEFGGWKGRIFALGLIPFWDIDPQIVTLFYDDTTHTYAYAEGQGTSEAAPMVTGSVALILQQYREQFEIDLAANPPLPSTIKAILIQTADDMVHETADPRDVSNPDTGAPVLYYEGPDFATGYGLVNVEAAVYFVAEDPGPGAAARLLHENELDSYQKHIYKLWLTYEDIYYLNGQLKFTLAWDDYPGDPALASTTPKLVNDLDLYLIGPDGTTHLPWTLDPLPVNDCGGKGPVCGDLDPIKPGDVKPARRDVDHLNNVEMVQVDNITPGQWLVMVSPHNIPMPMQKYSLVGNQPTQFAPQPQGLTLTIEKKASGDFSQIVGWPFKVYNLLGQEVDSFTIAAGDSYQKSLASGTYTIKETNSQGCTPSVKCVGAAAPTGADSVTVNLVTNTTCIFTNDCPGSPVEDPCAVVPGNLIANCGFEGGRVPWRIWTDAQAYFKTSSDNPFAGDNAAEYRITVPGSNVQLYQKNITLQPNTTYELSFAAYSNNGRDMGVVVHKHGKPYTNYGLNIRHIDLDKAWRLYSYTFETPNLADMSDGRLRFWFAPYTEAGTVYHIDHVVLRPVQ